MATKFAVFNFMVVEWEVPYEGQGRVDIVPTEVSLFLHDSPFIIFSRLDPS